MFQFTNELDDPASEDVDVICWHIIRSPNAEAIEAAFSRLIENLKKLKAETAQ